MKILSIETSCDETAISIIEINKEITNFQVISDLVISQIDIHKKYGGVFPALAKREHAKNLVPLLQQSFLEDSSNDKEKINLSEKQKNTIKKILGREPGTTKDLIEFFEKNKAPRIDIIAVTYGPGLTPALWVGVNFARALSIVLNAKLIPINHMEGHISSIILKENYRNEKEAILSLTSFKFPMIALLISGGHTQIVLVKNWGNYEILGESIDDAVGEAFDKVARMLGMEYPGGPKISQSAQNGKENEKISLPRPMFNSGDYSFSFSGLKTAVMYKIRDLKKESKSEKLNEQTIADIAKEFEYAVTEVLLKKTMKAIDEYNAKTLIIAGGVSANTFIRETFMKETKKRDIKLYTPEKLMCGDNSLMIATSAFLNLRNKKIAFISPGGEINAIGNLKLNYK